jgi:VanZ family protein
MSTHATPGYRAAVPLLLAWSALVVYASWFPLTGWRWPTTGLLFGLLRLPWPRWHDAFDVVANLLGYVPLGACLALTLARGTGDGARTGWRAVLAGSAVSYLLEVGQGLLPQRVPSLLDWLLNTAGATAGVVLGLWIERTSPWGWLRRTGEHWFMQHSRTGLALLLLWPLGLLFPTPVALGLGHVWEPMGEVVHEATGSTPGRCTPHGCRRRPNCWRWRWVCWARACSPTAWRGQACAASGWHSAPLCWLLA